MKVVAGMRSGVSTHELVATILDSNNRIKSRYQTMYAILGVIRINGVYLLFLERFVDSSTGSSNS